MKCNFADPPWEGHVRAQVAELMEQMGEGDWGEEVLEAMFEDEPEETDENSKKIREEVDEAKLWLEEEAVKIKKREHSLFLSE